MDCLVYCIAHFGHVCDPKNKNCERSKSIDHEHGTGVDTRKSGDELISEERAEQVMKHGRSILYDIANNGNGELIMMADALIICNYVMTPDNWDRGHIDKMMAKTEVQRLVIAGALIAAEIDRLNLQAKISHSNKSDLEDGSHENRIS